MTQLRCARTALRPAGARSRSRRRRARASSRSTSRSAVLLHRGPGGLRRAGRGRCGGRTRSLASPQPRARPRRTPRTARADRRSRGRRSAPGTRGAGHLVATSKDRSARSVCRRPLAERRAAVRRRRHRHRAAAVDDVGNARPLAPTIASTLIYSARSAEEFAYRERAGGSGDRRSTRVALDGHARTRTDWTGGTRPSRRGR